MRLRGGGANVKQPAPDAAAVTHARLLILLSGAIYGTYPVFLRALNVVGGEPLPSAFVTFARYQILTVLAAGLQALRRLQQRSKSSPKAAAPSSSPAAASSAGGGASLWVAACELATYTVLGSLLSVWGIGRLPSVTSEILGSTIHVFVPLLTIWLLGRANATFGLNTWLGCILAFAAAIISTVADGASFSGESTGGVDATGSVAVLIATMIYALQRVRTQVHLRSHESEALNSSRMICMGLLSAVPLFFDVAAGGASRATVLRIRHVTSIQWGLLFLSVFSSAFIASSMQFSALRVISAANAQPFSALQPVFAAGWSMALLSEPITRGAMVGGLAMIGATLLASTDKTSDKKQEKTKMNK